MRWTVNDRSASHKPFHVCRVEDNKDIEFRIFDNTVQLDAYLWDKKEGYFRIGTAFNLEDAKVMVKSFAVNRMLFLIKALGSK